MKVQIPILCRLGLRTCACVLDGSSCFLSEMKNGHKSAARVKAQLAGLLWASYIVLLWHSELSALLIIDQTLF